MILSESDFGRATQGGSPVACLPQPDQDWCLAVKVGSATGYLGNVDGKELLFPTLDRAIECAKNFEVGQVLVITGSKPWRF